MATILAQPGRKQSNCEASEVFKIDILTTQGRLLVNHGMNAVYIYFIDKQEAHAGALVSA